METLNLKRVNTPLVIEMKCFNFIVNSSQNSQPFNRFKKQLGKNRKSCNFHIAVNVNSSKILVHVRHVNANKFNTKYCFHHK